MRLSPCLHCLREMNPADCENKGCNRWRQWYVENWDQMRLQVSQRLQGRVAEPVGVVVGGRHYAAPHQVQRYLMTDPCEGCLCPRELCGLPCGVKKNWLAAREEVFGEGLPS